MTQQVELTIPVLQALLAQAQSEIDRKKSGLKIIGVNKLAVLARRLTKETFAKLTSQEAAQSERLNVMAVLKFQEPFNAHVAILQRSHHNAMGVDYLTRLLLLVQSEAVAECEREDKAQEQFKRLQSDAEHAATFEHVQRVLNDTAPVDTKEGAAVVSMLEQTADLVGALHKLEMPELAEVVRQAVITKPLLESAVGDALAHAHEQAVTPHRHNEHWDGNFGAACNCGHDHQH